MKNSQIKGNVAEVNMKCEKGKKCLYGGESGEGLWEEQAFSVQSIGKPEEAKPSLLLHSCCGPCSTSVIERLLPDYNITVFFFNPNITDKEEYEKRKAAQLKFIGKYNQRLETNGHICFKEGEYNPDFFFKATAGMENEPEGGERCVVCERIRLEQTAIEAHKEGYDFFATTLTVSPHKNYEAITMVGTELSIIYGLSYLDIDFKKKGGFQRSVEMSKQYDLYRQSFCGCIYSKR